MKIVVEPKFAKYLDKLSKDERAILEQQLLKDGCTDPLIVWKRGDELVMIDGHNRYEICRKHAIAFKTFEMEFENEDEALQLMRMRQAGRRNTPLDKWRSMVGRVYNHQKKKAASNLIPNAANAVSHSNVQIEHSSETLGKQGPSKTTAEVTAEGLGVSASTVRRLGVVAEVEDTLFSNGEESAAEAVAKAPMKVVQAASKVLHDESKPEPKRIAEAAKVITTPPPPKPAEPPKSRAATSTRPVSSKATQFEIIKEITRLVGKLNDTDYILCMKHLANTRMIDKRRSIEVVIESLHKSLPEKDRKHMQLPLFDPKPEELPLPESIASTAVSEAWKIWCRHLKTKKVEWSVDEANSQLKQLARSKPAKVVQIIEYAIANRMTQLPLAKDVPEDFTEMEEDEVIAYAKNRGYSISDARDFFLHYASQGWKKGNGQPVTNWKFQLSRWVSGQDKPLKGKVARKDGAVYVPGDEVESGAF